MTEHKTINKDSFKILIIIPAFNEEKSVVAVAKAARDAYENVDVLVVNDKSTDRTERVLQEHDIDHLSLPTNLGIGGAVQSGFIFAERNNYDIAVQVDGDGQHPPEQIPLLVTPILQDGVDFVIGSRYLQKSQIVSSFARRLGGGMLATFIWMNTGKKVTDPTSGFRAYNQRAIKFLSRNYPQEYPEPISVIELLDCGFKLVEIPVKMKERQFGQSSITGANTFFYMLKVMFAIIIAKLRRGGSYA